VFIINQCYILVMVVCQILCPLNSVQVQDPWRKAVQKDSERLWRKGFVKEMSFKSGVKGRGSDRWWERVKIVTVLRWLHRLRWIGRRVNRMRLVEWRRDRADSNLTTYTILSVQSTGRTRSSSLVSIARPSVSSSLQITNRSFTYASPYLWYDTIR